MTMTLSAALVAVQPEHRLSSNPSLDEIKSATSLHVLAFSSHGDLLVIESEGDFSLEVWEAVYEKARIVCRGQEGTDEDSEEADVSMNEDVVETDFKLEDLLKNAVQEKILKERKWRESLG